MIDQCNTDAAIDKVAETIGRCFRRIPILGYLLSPVCEPTPPPNPAGFSEMFVEANRELEKGNIEGLTNGIRLLKQAEKFGHCVPCLRSAVHRLEIALKHYDRADRNGPWNWAGKGYGLFSWKNDLYDRDTALREAWEWIKQIDDWLKPQGLGYTPGKKS